MAKVEHYYTKFEEGKFYHIYNRSVDKQPMFKSDDNYRFFLVKLNKYLNDVLGLYAYCLLGNHFHLLIRIKDDLSGFRTSKNINIETSTHDVVSKLFKNFFQSYAMAYNVQQNRSGTLFQTPFKRVLINDESYLTQIIFYIHANPQKHTLVSDFRNWKWSSYNSIISKKPSNLKRQEVLEWFGGEIEFLRFHSEIHNQIREKNSF
ncbi:hypothetical protein [Pedobacter jejuensis]|uniref:Transposase IS200-like domain-containing protein n=1 Tax=Pedobacter jejuensis TaxID=1268550 RepID=A0A3N0BLV5_9SPHI|nr:hypothetical protein [Pedobacter jejuensis]RNL49644.1 hypothetical protein D7004_19725 [Pedobacter jejuensis]